MKSHLSVILVLLMSFWGIVTGQQTINKPDREQWFMDMRFGMFIRWSMDSQSGAVISHSMAQSGSSED